MVFFLPVLLAVGGNAAGVVGAVLDGLWIGAAIYYLRHPPHIPGPTDRDYASVHVAALSLRVAQQDPACPPETVRRLHEQLERLRALVEEKERQQRDFPVPKYLLKSQRAGNINIGITGKTGAGKSAFINALRHVKPGTPGAAAEDDGGECTREPTMYRLPGQPNVRLQTLCRWAGRPWQCLQRRRQSSVVPAEAQDGDECGEDSDDGLIQPGRRVLLRGADPPKLVVLQAPVEHGTKWCAQELCTGQIHIVGKDDIHDMLAECLLWDLPGAGTAKFPQAEYVNVMGLRYFDAVIFVASSRHTEAEEAIMEELRRYEVPFLVVRTHIDESVMRVRENAEEDGKEAQDAAEKQELDNIRAKVTQSTKVEKVYLVSSRPKTWEQWDFPELRMDLNMTIQHARNPGNTEEECYICREKYVNFGGKAGVRTEAEPCGHALCSTCWSILCARQALCPFCRLPVFQT